MANSPHRIKRGTTATRPPDPPAVEEPLPPPDPKREGAELLAYIKKRSGGAERWKCELKCKEFGLDLEVCLRVWKGKIEAKRVSTKGEVLHFIVILDMPWATQWLRFYDLDPPHHGQPQVRRMSQ